MKVTNLRGMTIPEALTSLDPTWRVKMVPSMGSVRPWIVTGDPAAKRKVRGHVRPLPLP